MDMTMNTKTEAIALAIFAPGSGEFELDVALGTTIGELQKALLSTLPVPKVSETGVPINYKVFHKRLLSYLGNEEPVDGIKIIAGDRLILSAESIAG
jgi:hypothetical protein